MKYIIGIICVIAIVFGAVHCVNSGIVSVNKHQNVFTGETTKVSVSVNTKEARNEFDTIYGTVYDNVENFIESL